MHLRNCILTLASILTTASALPAATIYTTFLSAGNEVPPTGTAATGSATLTLNGNTLTVAESFTGLSSAATGAHIHCCAALGTNVAIAVPFTSFPASTSGIYSQNYDLTMAATYTSGFLAASGGTAAAAQSALVAGLNASLAYLNIHDATFPGGEIRGQLTPQGTTPPTVPEPTTTALLLAGIVPMITILRRRSRKA